MMSEFNEPDAYTVVSAVLDETGGCNYETMSAITGLPPVLVVEVFRELSRRGVIDAIDRNTGESVDIDKEG